MNEPPDPKSDLRGLRIAASLTTVGLQLAISVALGVGLGMLLDRWLKTNWMVIVGTLLGVIAGFKNLIEAVIRANKDQEELDAEERRRDRR